MWPLIAILSAAVIFGAGPAHAEHRIFIIDNSPDSYGVDRCLASGAACGAAAASAYCRSNRFAQARSFRKVDREEITGAVPSSAGCAGGRCTNFVAIECMR
jgi:hypothetical protein